MEKKEWVGYLLILPAYLILIFVIFYPTGQAFWMSFHKIVLIKPWLGRPFIGFENYREVIASPMFSNSLKLTFIWTIINLIIQMVLGMAVALLINKKIKGRGLVRGIVLIPWITPSVVAALTWKWMYDAQFGILNTLLVKMGIIETGIAWLGNVDTALYSVIIESIWKGSPFVILMLLAALQAIPEDLYEASRIDGAGAVRVFRHITVPLILPSIIIAATLTTIYTFNNFNAIWLMTSGGPLNSSEILNILVYRLAFQDFNLGEACATGMIVFGILYVFVLIFGHYYIKAQAGRS